MNSKILVTYVLVLFQMLWTAVLSVTSIYSLGLNENTYNQYTMTIYVGTPAQELEVLLDFSSNQVFLFNETIANLSNSYFNCSKSESCFQTTQPSSHLNSDFYEMTGETHQEYVNIVDQFYQVAQVQLCNEITMKQYTNFTNIAGIFGIGVGSLIYNDNQQTLVTELYPGENVWGWNRNYTPVFIGYNGLMVGYEQLTTTDSKLITNDNKSISINGTLDFNNKTNVTPNVNYTYAFNSQYINFPQKHFDTYFETIQAHTPSDQVLAKYYKWNDTERFMGFKGLDCNKVDYTNFPAINITVSTNEYFQTISLAPQTLMTNYEGVCFMMIYNMGSDVDEDHIYLGTAYMQEYITQFIFGERITIYFNLTVFPELVDCKLEGFVIDNLTSSGEAQIWELVSFFGAMWLFAFGWTSYVKFQHKKEAKAALLELKQAQQVQNSPKSQQSIEEESLIEESKSQ